MKIKVDVSKEEYKNFSVAYYIKNKLIIKLIIIGFISAVISFNMNNQYSFPWERFLLTFNIIFFIGFLIWFLLPYYLFNLKIKKINIHKYTIISNFDGLDLLENSHILKWQQLKSITIVNSYIFLKTYNSGIYLIPFNSFLSNEQAMNFSKQIEFEIFKIRSSSARHLYYWGFIGLIPNIGLIAGLIFIIKGLIKYNDNKLVLIGVADILFTIIFWTVIFKGGFLRTVN